MPQTKGLKSAHLTPAQRRDEIVGILAGAVVRLQQRAALPGLPTSPRRRKIALDSCSEIPLSVANGRQNG
jgi:hypothetical protein